MSKTAGSQSLYQNREVEGQMPTGFSCFKKEQGAVRAWHDMRRFSCFTCCVIFSKVLLTLLSILQDQVRWMFSAQLQDICKCKCLPLCRSCAALLHEIVIKTPSLRHWPLGSKLQAALWQLDVPKYGKETIAAWFSAVDPAKQAGTISKPEHRQVTGSMEVLSLPQTNEVWIMVFSLRASVRIRD